MTCHELQTDMGGKSFLVSHKTKGFFANLCRIFGIFARACKRTLKVPGAESPWVLTDYQQQFFISTMPVNLVSGDVALARALVTLPFTGLGQRLLIELVAEACFEFAYLSSKAEVIFYLHSF